ncbi:MAG: hypothetical protein AB7U38_06450 [Hyphomicrobiales bacterium]
MTIPFLHHGSAARAARTAATACLGVLLLTSVADAAQANPFSVLAGNWQGSGTLEPMEGSKERVICRVNYSVSDSSINQSINCAGTDYRIDATGNFSYAEGKLSGHWSEANYGASGSATGTVTGSTVFVRINGDKFTGRMKFNLSGSSHSVAIEQFNAGNGRYSTVADVSLRR